jgi:hypothetical protein
MKCKGDEPEVSEGLILGHGDVGVVALLAPQGKLAAPPLGCQPAKLLDHIQDAMDHIIPRRAFPRQQGQQPASLRVPHSERILARPLPSILEESKPQARHNRPRTDGTWITTLLLPTTQSDGRQWQGFHRLVGLSGLGWAFVLTAVLWEVFALAFSQCAGWGWDKGAFFFAWGLGVFAFGFYLRTSRKRSGVSGLFLGVNILVLSVLSLVVATR